MAHIGAGVLINKAIESFIKHLIISKSGDLTDK